MFWNVEVIREALPQASKLQNKLEKQRLYAILTLKEKIEEGRLGLRLCMYVHKVTLFPTLKPLPKIPVSRISDSG